VIPPTLNWNVTGWLVYDSANPLPQPAVINEYNDFDDITLQAYDQEPLWENPAYTITVDFIMGNLGDGAN
jgi:iron transport multicopper oxidase